MSTIAHPQTAAEQAANTPPPKPVVSSQKTDDELRASLQKLILADNVHAKGLQTEMHLVISKYGNPKTKDDVTRLIQAMTNASVRYQIRMKIGLTHLTNEITGGFTQDNLQKTLKSYQEVLDKSAFS